MLSLLGESAAVYRDLPAKPAVIRNG